MKDIEKVYKIIEEKFGVEEFELKSRGNTRDMVNIRRIISIVLIKNTYLTLEEIGKSIGRDYSTVSYYKDNTESLFLTDKKLLRDYEDVSFSFNFYNSNIEEKLNNLLRFKDKIELEISKTQEAIRFNKQQLNLV